VDLRFDSTVARRVRETIWHQSQEVADLPDGSVLLRLVVAEPTELKHWVLGWGEHCQVLSPPAFIQEVARTAAAMAAIYARQPEAVGRAG
jgi:predicted DNA-binding transcriptional regulator YafY